MFRLFLDFLLLTSTFVLVFYLMYSIYISYLLLYVCHNYRKYLEHMPYNVGAWRALGQLGKIVREEEEKIYTGRIGCSGEWGRDRMSESVRETERDV